MSPPLPPYKPVFPSLDKLDTDQLPFPLEKIGNAVAVPGSRDPGYSAIYRNQATPDFLYDKVTPELDTYYSILKRSFAEYPENDCIAERKQIGPDEWEEKFTPISYADVDKESHQFGSGLMYIVSKNEFRTDTNVPDAGYIVSIFSRNRGKWLLSDIACTLFALPNTALYDTLGPDTSVYILKLTESPVCIASGEKIERLLELKEKNKEALKNFITIVSMDELEPERFARLSRKAYELNIKLYDWNQVVEVGAKFPHDEIPPKPDTIYSLSFTSGTTGPPKGAILLHSGVAAGVAFTSITIMRPKNETGKLLSILPLAHIYERMTMALNIFNGSCLGFAHKPDPAYIVPNLKLFKPNIFSGVPRLFNKFEVAIKNATIYNQQLPAIQKRMAHRIIDWKAEKQASKDGESGDSWLYDQLLTNKLRAAIGFDNIKGSITGSAPINADTIKFLKAALGIPLHQGYGLTETFAGCCVSPGWDSTPGSSGSIGVATEMRLRDTPELGYTSDDPEGPRGELLLRGGQVFPGYYKNEEETRKAFDDDGWFRTGDIARLDEKGRIHVIDRVKNLFKLAQGEYVAPERIENVYLSSCTDFVAQMYVHGDSLQTFLVGIVGVEIPGLLSFFKRKHPEYYQQLSSKSEAEIINAIESDRNIRKAILTQMNKNVSHAGLNGFEKLHNIKVAVEPLKVEDEVLTPTLKLKRANAHKKFKEELKHLYEEGSLIKNEKL